MRQIESREIGPGQNESGGSRPDRSSLVDEVPSRTTIGLWRNGSASDSRLEGWAFESLWPHFLTVLYGFVGSWVSYVTHKPTNPQTHNPTKLRNNEPTNKEDRYYWRLWKWGNEKMREIIR